MTVLPLQFGGGWALPGLTGLPLFGRRPGGKAATKIDGTAGNRFAPNDSAAGALAPPAILERSVDKRSDELLLADHIEGDRTAFPKLMGRYADELLHFLTRFLGSRPAADDVFQEAFLQVHLSAETFDTERRFKPWLFTIAANKARDYHRKHSRSSAVSLSASIDSSGDGERFVDLLEADIPNPDSPLLDAERSRLVKHVIDAMPVHLREILLLSYFQRLSYNQISDSLEIPLGTVKSRLHTAVAAFARGWQAARGHDERDEHQRQAQPLNGQGRGIDDDMDENDQFKNLTRDGGSA